MIHQLLKDNFGRPITYLRLAVTDRCNLRCFYCMPEEGIRYLPKKELLTYEEMERLVRITAEMGISKVRITGGEPFVRKDMIGFLERLSHIPGLSELHITTNGVLTHPYVQRLKEMGIQSVNLSMDTLNKKRFAEITRRDEFEQVQKTLDMLLQEDIPVKINMVVMDGKNTQDILSMAALTKDLPVSVRFIEEMPFNGTSKSNQAPTWDHQAILEHLRSAYPDMEKTSDPLYSTASHYHIPKHRGDVGIIAAYTRTFCGSCNRIRVTSQGLLKTCLYDRGVLDIKKLLRSSADNDEIKKYLIQAIQHRHRNGWEAEAARDSHDIHESMSTIGG